MRMVKQKPIYSPDYYRMKILVSDKSFQARVRDARQAWARWDVPVPGPDSGRTGGYSAWLGRLRAAIIKAEDSEAMARAMERISNDQTISENEKMQQRFEAWRTMLPPSPNSVIDGLLEDFGLDPKDIRYRLFLITHIFFHREDFIEPFSLPTLKRNERTGEMELYLKLDSYSKAKRVLENWDLIESSLKMLPGYRSRNRRWVTFERDLQIYKVYRQVEELTDEAKRKEFGTRRVDEIVWRRLKEINSLRFRNMSFEQLRKAKSRVAALGYPVKVNVPA